MRGGVVVGATNGTFGWLMLLVVIVLIALIVRRLGEPPVIRVITVAMAVALAFGPLISLYNGLRSGRSNVEPATSIDNVDLDPKPDIFLVVADVGRVWIIASGVGPGFTPAHIYNGWD